jgi:methylenetetrahydrofolate dehydrogenase (NADP+) / methenyltetrahydrofolate cyclohydrolase
MELLDGKLTSQTIKGEIAAEVENHVKSGKRVPHLAAILVGESGASVTYVNAKIKDCEAIGFRSSLIALPESTTEEELLRRIDSLNADADLDGYIVQLPLPKHINEYKITQAIAPEKDVDGFHPVNVGKMAMGMDTFLPATPYGIMELLERYKVPTTGKHCVVIGRSNIVGRPMSILLSGNRNPGNCTVTITHSKTTNLKELCLQADIVVAALGRPEFLNGDMVKQGATVIDVGITRVEDKSKKSGFRLSGDVHFESVAPKCAYITPVPGGVGPMTRAALLMNTMRAYSLNMSKQ